MHNIYISYIYITYIYIHTHTYMYIYIYIYTHTYTRPGADCGSDHEFLIAKFRIKLKNVGKTTRIFRYDLIKSLMIIKWK